MSEPYLGEIRMFAGNFAPQGWHFCDGSLLAITQNSALYALIGITYGGDGQATFALPDLRSRVPIHQGTGQSPGNANTYTLGQNGGEETVILTTSQMPAHSHLPQASAGGGGNPVNSPANGFWSESTAGQFSTQAPSVNLAAAAVGANGGSQPHDNMVPYLAVGFIIALQGVFPSRS